MFYRHEIKEGPYTRDEKGNIVRIPIAQCKTGRLYRIDSRNFGSVAVFDAETHNGFYGVRRKFNSYRLDVEYHWENGAPYGTCNPWEELPEEMPEGVGLYQSEPAECQECGEPVEFKPDSPDKPTPGKWFHTSGKVNDACLPEWEKEKRLGSGEVRPVSRTNEKLFKWLMAMEEKYLGPPNWKPEWLEPEVPDDEEECD